MDRPLLSLSIKVFEFEFEFSLSLSLEKSQVVIFRNGGYIAAREKWFYDGMKLKIVNHYKYLGIIFSTGLTFSYALKDMSDRARKGALGFLDFCGGWESNFPNYSLS